MEVSVKTVETKPAFVPFDLVIRVETQEEADALYAIHMHTAICEPTRVARHDKIRDAIEAYGGRLSDTSWQPLLKSIREYRN